MAKLRKKPSKPKFPKRPKSDASILAWEKKCTEITNGYKKKYGEWLKEKKADEALKKKKQSSIDKVAKMKTQISGL